MVWFGAVRRLDICSELSKAGGAGASGRFTARSRGCADLTAPFIVRRSGLKPAEARAPFGAAARWDRRALP